MKTCGKCKELLEESSFHRASREKSGLQPWCKTCRKGWKSEERKEYHKNRYHDNKDNYLNWTYQRHYGITLEEYNTMLENQNGVCSICNKECSSGRRLSVDHNHETGAIRSLLCGNCNKGLGCFQDNPDLLLKSIEYLNKHV